LASSSWRPTPPPLRRLRPRSRPSHPCPSRRGPGRRPAPPWTGDTQEQLATAAAAGRSCCCCYILQPTRRGRGPCR
jgi:hypothetical protein